MKIERSCRTKADATVMLGGFRRILCSLFLVSAVVAAVGAVASPRANQGGSTPPKAMAKLVDGANSGGKAALSSLRVADQKIAPWVIEHTGNGHQAEFFVVLADHADLTGAADLADQG